MLHCAIFWFKWFQGLDVSETTSKISNIENMDENVTKCCFYMKWMKKDQGKMVLVISLPF